MTTDAIGMLHAADLDVWCMQQGTNVIDWTKKYYLKEYAQMITLDYILANTDRHMWNWSFYVSMLTGEILKPHPLYDHNNCFDYDALIDETWKSILEQGKTMKEAAQHYVKRSELKMIKTPTKKMFPSPLAYEVFKERCKQLNLWQEDLKSTLFTNVKTLKFYFSYY